jgi:exopolysaccharide production protein ExoQ
MTLVSKPTATPLRPTPNKASWEESFAWLGLVYYAAPFGSPSFVPGIVVTLLRYGIWALSVLLLMARYRHTLYTATRDLWVWGVMGLSAFSFLWSVFPAVSQTASIDVFQMGAFALYLASRFSLRQQTFLVASSLVAGAIISLIVGIALPSVGIHGADHPGSWRGAFDYKNTLGSYMALGAVSCFLVATDREKPSPSAWWGIVLCILMVVLSTSKTALVVSVLVLGFVYFCREFRWRGKVAVVILDLALLVVSSILILVFGNWVSLLSGLGKDPTLTGRTPMWGEMLNLLWQRPLLGFGRSAFFSGGSVYAHQAGAATALSFVPPHAHNGFLELALDIGVLGFALFTISYLVGYFRAVQRTSAGRNAGDFWPLAFLTFVALNNITESYLMRMTHLYWVLFMATVLSLPKLQNQVVAPQRAKVAAQSHSTLPTAPAPNPQLEPRRPEMGDVESIPGQGIPGQGIPGQGIPGQGIPGQGIPGQTTRACIVSGHGVGAGLGAKKEPS